MQRLTLCRVCLSTNTGHVAASTPIRDVFEKLTAIPFQTDDLRPLALCYICHAQLNAARRLMVKCLKAEELLTQLIHQLLNQNVAPKVTLIDRTALNHMAVTEIQQIIIANTGENIDIEFKEDSQIYHQEVKLEEDMMVPEFPDIPDNHSEPDNDIKTITLQEAWGIPAENIHQQPQDNVQTKDEPRTSKAIPRKTKVVPRKSKGNQTKHSKSDISKKIEIAVEKEGEEETQGRVKERKLISKGVEGIPTDDNQHVNTHDIVTSPGHIKTCDKSRKYTLKHSRRRPKDKRYTCDVCAKSFRVKDSIRIHVLTHTGENPYTCKVCAKTFFSKNNLKRHTLIHSGKKPYVCDVCAQSFVAKDGLKRHISTHTGEKPYGCNVCEKSYTSKEYLRTHSFIHTGEKPYVCNVCNKGFRQKATMRVHSRKHAAEKPYVCNVCGDRFSEQSNLTSHANMHGDQKVFARNANTSMSYNEKLYICDVCGKSYYNKTLFIGHYRLHTGDKPYVCKICNKSFTQISTLKTHEVLHTGEKPYVCSVCERAFNSKNNLKRHELLHTGLKPYICNVCSKSFAQKCSLTVHMRVHTGEKPYTCSVCDKSFADRSTWVKHQRLHCTR